MLRSLLYATLVILLPAAEAFAQSGPFQFYPIVPCRVFDTREAAGPTGGAAIPPFSTRNFQVRGKCGVPTTARAASFNVTITDPTQNSHLTLWPSNASRPNVSTINFTPRDPALANGAVIPLGTATADLSVFNAEGYVHVILDVTGYFQ
jgi:hypothetical protein